MHPSVAKHRIRIQASTVVIVAILVAIAAPSLAPAEELSVGFGAADITPAIDGKRPVWIAGYGPGRRATGVHDRLFARAVVLRDGERKIALVSVDLVGLQYAQVLRIRKELRDYAYVGVFSTHNHEGPDVVGLWGATPLTSGVDASYLALIARRIVSLVRGLETKLAPAHAAYGTADDPALLGDSRLPKVLDDRLRVLRFSRPSGGELLGLLVQWNCHPESLGSANTLITADFPAATVAWLEKRYGVPVAYFTGAVGGLMAPPECVIKDKQGRLCPRATSASPRRMAKRSPDWRSGRSSRAGRSS